MEDVRGAADDALDRLWGDFFRLRVGVDSGAVAPVEGLARFRELHRIAGATGSSSVPVFRAEIRGEITRIKDADRLRPGAPDSAAGAGSTSSAGAAGPSR